MLTKGHANIAGDVILEPLQATQEAEAAWIAQLKARPWLIQALSRHGIGGKWTGVFALG